MSDDESPPPPGPPGEAPEGLELLPPGSPAFAAFAAKLSPGEYTEFEPDTFAVRMPMSRRGAGAVGMAAATLGWYGLWGGALIHLLRDGSQHWSVVAFFVFFLLLGVVWIRGFFAALFADHYLVFTRERLLWFQGISWRRRARVLPRRSVKALRLDRQTTSYEGSVSVDWRLWLTTAEGNDIKIARANIEHDAAIWLGGRVAKWAEVPFRDEVAGVLRHAPVSPDAIADPAAAPKAMDPVAAATRAADAADRPERVTIIPPGSPELAEVDLLFARADAFAPAAPSPERFAVRVDPPRRTPGTIVGLAVFGTLFFFPLPGALSPWLVEAAGGTPVPRATPLFGHVMAGGFGVAWMVAFGMAFSGFYHSRLDRLWIVVEPETVRVYAGPPGFRRTWTVPRASITGLVHADWPDFIGGERGAGPFWRLRLTRPDGSAVPLLRAEQGERVGSWLGHFLSDALAVPFGNRV